MQPGRGTEIDGDAEWNVTEIVDHVLGMIILMGQRIGYAAMRKVIAMERSHPWDDYCIDYEPKGI